MPTSCTHLQPIHIEQIDLFIPLMQALQDEDPGQIPFDDSRARRAVEVLLHNPEYGRAWFVEEAGRIVGYIVLSFDFSLEYGGRNAWIDEFYIEPSSRGRGLGAQVLVQFEQAAGDAGVTAIHLGVRHDNPAIHLYRRAGFQAHQSYLMTKRLI